MIDVELQNRIAWTLYKCEANRAAHARAVLEAATGNEIKGLIMEPWEDAKEAFLADAAAVLNAIATPDQQVPHA